ncbi:MAG: phosphate-starvation-inducible PsiE family protein [Anaeromyxobacteraceae bacterium]
MLFRSARSQTEGAEIQARTQSERAAIPARNDRMRSRLGDAGARLDSGVTRWFNRLVDLIVRLLVPLAVVALMLGVARVFLDLGAVYRSPSIGAGFDLLVTDILSMFVVIELLKSIVDYLEVHKINITFILDAAVVFVVREVMIGLYKHAFGAGEIAALAVLLLVLGAFRVAAVRFLTPREHAHAFPRGVA